VADATQTPAAPPSADQAALDLAEAHELAEALLYLAPILGSPAAREVVAAAKKLRVAFAAFRGAVKP
jgi:alkylhydroperoxidase/carboxymuconolactone decarboxylase family protein YurZ